MDALIPVVGYFGCNKSSHQQKSSLRWKIVDNFSFLFYAATLPVHRCKWYLCRLKPQKISPISKISFFSPLLRALVYDLFHFITPNVPSDWILRFINKILSFVVGGNPLLLRGGRSLFKAVIRNPPGLTHEMTGQNT